VGACLPYVLIVKAVPKKIRGYSRVSRSYVAVPRSIGPMLGMRAAAMTTQHSRSHHLGNCRLPNPAATYAELSWGRCYVI